mmetsp:Transcript_34914/g.78443  ORF Transcript_34914/g.78443 Transcript_34914/m.78443 type:complete len:195 (+) Transcript_34914:342-926(+)
MQHCPGLSSRSTETLRNGFGARSYSLGQSRAYFSESSCLGLCCNQHCYATKLCRRSSGLQVRSVRRHDLGVVAVLQLAILWTWRIVFSSEINTSFFGRKEIFFMDCKQWGSLYQWFADVMLHAILRQTYRTVLESASGGRRAAGACETPGILACTMRFICVLERALLWRLGVAVETMSRQKVFPGGCTHINTIV